MEWITKRGREASSYLGLGSIVLGLGELLQINEAPVIAGAVAAAGQVAASGESWINVAAFFGMGLLGLMIKDKNNTQ